MDYQIMATNPQTGQVLANKEMLVKVELRLNSGDGETVWSKEETLTSSKNGEASYVTGTCVTIISAQTTTGIKGINAIKDKPYYSLQGYSLKVYRSACLYSLDGRQICSINADTQISIDALPDVFIIKFKDGTNCKLQK